MIAAPSRIAQASAAGTARRAPARRTPLIATAALFALLVGGHILARHQGAGWTSPLLILDHLFDLGFAAAMLLYASAIGRTIARPLLVLGDDRLTEGLVAIGLGLGALSLTLLVAGFLHLYYGAVFLIAWLALTAWLRIELCLSVQAIWIRCASWLRSGMPTAPSLGQRLSLLLVTCLLCIHAVRATLPVSPNVSGTEGDALAYHISAPNLYLMAHRFVPLPDMPLANTPSGSDLLLIPGLLAGSDTTGKMLAFLCALLLGAATFALGRRFFSRDSAWLGVLLLFNTIWLAPIMPTTIPDFAAAFLLVAGATDLFAHLQCKLEEPPIMVDVPNRGVRRGGWDIGDNRLLIRAGLLIGFGISFKLTNLPAIPAAAVTLGGICLCGSGPLLLRAIAGIRAGTVFCLAAFLPLSPWLAKNLYFFGNPLYPQGVSAAQQASNNGIGPAAVVVHQTAFERLVWIGTTLPTTYWQFTGPLCLLLPASVVLLRRWSGRSATLFLLLSGIVWLAFVPLYLPPRYWIGPIAIGDALIAATLYQIIERRLSVAGRIAFGAAVLSTGIVWLALIPFSTPSSFWLASIVIGEGLIALIIAGLLRQRSIPALLELPVIAYLCMSTVVALFLGIREMNRDQALAVAQGAISRDAYLGAYFYAYRAEHYASGHIPPHARVAMVHIGGGYYLQRWYLNDWYGERFSRLQLNARSRMAEMRIWCQAGITHAIVNRGAEEIGDDPHIHPIRYFAWTHLPGLAPRVLFSANSVDVLSIDPCAVTRAMAARAGGT